MSAIRPYPAPRKSASAAAGLLALLVLALLPAGHGVAAEAAAAKPSSGEALATLSAPAQAAISRVVGRDQRAYRASVANGALTFRNEAQRLSARFGRSGVEVRSGATRLRLSLRAFGYGEGLAPVAAAAPRAKANRVAYRRGPLTEWYLNGPLGLEQGFTLQRAPERRSGPLTLKLSLSGAAPTLLGGKGLGFANSTIRYRGLFAVDARGRRLPAWLELQGRTLLIRVSDARARYPVTIDPFIQQAKLVAGGEELDQLGHSIAISGDTVVVGASGADGFYGAAYVFVKPLAGWASGAQTAKLTASDNFGDAFGASVAISGDTVAVGAPNQDVGVDTNRGAAYVFVKPVGGWVNATQTAKLTASDGDEFDNLGLSVGISGDVVVAGAPGDDGLGSAYTFLKPGGGWAGPLMQTAKLTASDAAAGDGFGTSVAVSGGTVVAGAPGDDPGGSAYVFLQAGTVWTETAKLTASDTAAGDVLGTSVGVSADTVVAGAPGDDTNRGSAYVYVKSGGGWASATENAKLTASDGAGGDKLGSSVAIDADTVAAGAPGDDGGRGSAYIYVKPGGGWAGPLLQTAKLTASDGVAGDELGNSVAVSGDTVVAGAPRADVGGTDSGAAYVFEDPGTGWANGTENAKLRVLGGSTFDQLGNSVAISGDTIAVGAPAADDSLGAAYVFVKPLAGWASGGQTAKLTSSDNGGDSFGWSVAISGDTVVAGAPNQDVGIDANRGAAYVFVKPGGGWVNATENAKLTASDAAALDNFGFSVAVSGDVVVAGAPGDDSERGSAYTFLKPGGGWATTSAFSAKLTASDGVAGDDFGNSVAVSGGTVVVGADADNSSQGSAYVYIQAGTVWTETAKLSASDGAASDRLGFSVAVAADTVVAGAHGDDSSRGSAYVFVKPGGGWATTSAFSAKLTASDGVGSDRLGTSVAVDGDTAVAGADGDDGSRGSAYVFVKPGGGWAGSLTQSAKLTASDGVAGDDFGNSVAVSGDTVVAGAPLADVGGSDSGAAYVFEPGPTAVRLLSFAARRSSAGVVLRWRTASEVQTLGFNVYRERADKLVRLNRALVAAELRGGVYRFLDRRAPRAGSPRYWIEAVDLDGTRRWLAAVRLRH